MIIVAIFLVLIPWIWGIDFTTNNGVVIDGITISAMIVMTLTLIFSLISWFLFSWASKGVKIIGVPLSIITAASLVVPFLQVLGPMAGIIVGIVAGFAAFMFQKKADHPQQNRSLVIATTTLAATYFVLVMMILAFQTIENGIGEWTGTAEGMEKTGFDNILNNNIDFIFFLLVIPSLIMTGLLIHGKTILPTR